MMKGAKFGSALLVSAMFLSLGARDERRAHAGAGAAARAEATTTAPAAGASAAATEQAAAPEAAATDSAPTPPPANGGLEIGRELSGGERCPEGMVEVEGEYCPNVEQKCLRYIDPAGVFPRRCAEFAPTSQCMGKTIKKHFCIDRYEWPNKPGEDPVVMKTWYEARDACASIGKRLCGDTEWTVACEGQERLPYPYGYERSAEACNIDKPHPAVNERALGSSDPKVREAEAKRLWQGEPSGSRSACVSPYGVFDMTGNVDEWVVNESGQPYRSGLKGGYWGPVRDRCRPMTTVHSEGFSFYQIGFRCCSDVTEAASAGDDAPEPSGPSRLPSTSPPPEAAIVGS